MAGTKQPGTAQSADPVDKFLADLALRGHEPLLHGAAGTLRAIRPDASIRTERSLFEGMVTGTVNATAAMLRGVLVVDGDLGLLTAFSRLFPGPPRSLGGLRGRHRERSA